MKSINSNSNLRAIDNTNINDNKTDNNNNNNVTRNDSSSLLSPPPPPPGSEWQVIQAYQVIQDEKRTKAEQDLMR